MGSNSCLQISTHRSKAPDEIYKAVMGSRLGNCLEAAPAADLCANNGNSDVFRMLTFFSYLKNVLDLLKMCFLMC